MTSLVTGATGFLGSHLARRLVDRGDEVRVLVRSTSDRSRLDGLGLQFVEGDVTDRSSVMAAADGVDLVFHCAAVVEFGPRDPSFMHRINVEGAGHVLDASAANGACCVYVSSLAALGTTPQDAPPQDETFWDPAEPTVEYERTKRLAHEGARDRIASGESVRIAIPGGIYGMGDQSTMFDLIRAYSRWPLPLGYMPEIRQSTVNVQDCADALLRIASDGADGDEYIVVAEAVTIKEWLALIATGAGHRAPLVHLPTGAVRFLGGPGGTVAGWLGASPTMVPETVAVATHDSAYSGAKLRETLGWSPRSLADGMTEMAQAIQADEAERRRAQRSARAASRAERV